MPKTTHVFMYIFFISMVLLHEVRLCMYIHMYNVSPGLVGKWLHIEKNVL
jgi:hypothetical protein